MGEQVKGYQAIVTELGSTSAKLADRVSLDTKLKAANSARSYLDGVVTDLNQQIEQEVQELTAIIEERRCRIESLVTLAEKAEHLQAEHLARSMDYREALANQTVKEVTT